MTSTVLLIAAGALAAGVLIGWLLARAAGGAERARLQVCVVTPTQADLEQTGVVW